MKKQIQKLLVLFLGGLICSGCTVSKHAQVNAGNGLFSVGENKQVHFSTGNLQYKPNTDTWRSAECQYHYVGGKNANVDPSYDGWIDLFGWGTGNHPCDTSQDNANYATFEDWGNNVGEGWRTLTIEEWHYVLFDREDANAKYAIGTIDNVYHGLILLPDDWTLPEGCEFVPGCNGWEGNLYSVTQWQRMEAEGAIFLPATGRRIGREVELLNIGGYGFYWSSTPSQNFDYVYGMHFDRKYVGITEGGESKYFATSVRLVCDKK